MAFEPEGDQPDHVALDISDTPHNGISLWCCLAIGFIIQMIFVRSSIINNKALNEGMKPVMFATYRNLLASILLALFAMIYERNVRPHITLWILLKIFLLAIFEPVLDQIHFNSGIFITSATFSSSLSEVLPGLTFFVSWILRAGLQSEMDNRVELDSLFIYIRGCDVLCSSSFS